MNILSLLLPALIPSWRFFDGIAPSPRIEFARLNTPEDVPEWEEFKPRPRSISLKNILKRLFWNPDWNEYLFLVSCSERIRDQPTAHSIKVIQSCLSRDLALPIPILQFRVVFVSIEGGRLIKEILYTSDVKSNEL